MMTGVSELKAEKFGEQWLGIIKQFCEENPDLETNITPDESRLVEAQR
jgi:hypothetical protein